MRRPTRGRLVRWPARSLAAGAALLAALVAALAPLDGAGAAPAPGSRPYVIGFVPGELGQVTRAIRAHGGTVTSALREVDVVVADLTPAAAAALERRPGVVSVHRDSGVQLASSTYDAKADPSSMYTITSVIGARDGWSRWTGRGVDVALLDSGVTPVPGLHQAGRVVHGPDLSFESQNPALRHLDTYGHGTHMAGIIAGRDATWAAGASTEDGSSFAGVAPGARIISLKLADASGATDVSQVIAAIDWVVQHARDPGLNIRVLNLSFGTPSLQPYQVDPLAHAAEVAWRRGIVVVVSAGNDGTGTGRLANPARHPALLAVGAVDANGTRETDDDVVPAYSSRGDGVRNPDLVAPGAHVQGLRVPGSSVDLRHGSGPGAIDARFLRGSGTSQAAAVVSGAVALLLEQRPSLTPDQVKALLMQSARSLPAADRQAVGSGLVNVKRAGQLAVPATAPSSARSSGTGSLGQARGGLELVLAGVPLSGELDIFGQPFDAAAHAAAAERAGAWDGGAWNGQTWLGQTWLAGSWAGTAWTGGGWSDGSWNGQTWVGQTWVGQTWGGQTWGGQTWVGQLWAIDGWR